MTQKMRLTMHPPLQTNGLTENVREIASFSRYILSAPIRQKDITGDLLPSKDSLARCVVSEFKISAGIATKTPNISRRAIPTILIIH